MKIGIVGYGNLGAALVRTASQYGHEVYGVFSRRDKEALTELACDYYSFSEIVEHKGRIDAVINAGGSKTDLAKTTPALAEHFDIVDSYDIHSSLAQHRERTALAARGSSHVALVGVGWDPGLFSVLRIYMAAFSHSSPNTFWGAGVSQGHSQALRSIRGVKKAVEYTVPREEAVKRAERGAEITDDFERTKRICYVVADSEHSRIEKEIKSMPDYFLGYETEVHFITDGEFSKKHTELYHRGRLLFTRAGADRLKMDMSVSFSSNPNFTASVLLSAVNAIVKMRKNEKFGAYTMADIPPEFFLEEDKYWQYM